MKTLRSFGIGLILVASATLTFLSCSAMLYISGSGQMSREIRAVNDFDAVVLNGSGELTIEQGSSPSLTVEAEDNIISYVESTIEGRTLTLGLRADSWSHSIFTTRPTRYTLIVRDLTNVTVNGSGGAHIGAVRTPFMTVNVNGSGPVVVESLSASRLTATITGSGSVECSGVVDRSEASILSSGSAKLSGLSCNQAVVYIAGSGSCSVDARSSLDVSILGSGSVEYCGNPAITSLILGSGRLRPARAL